MKVKEQTKVLLDQLLITKSSIYAICVKCKCVNVEKCIEKSVVCTNDSSNKSLCIRNGADFNSYFNIRNNIIELNMGFIVQRASSLGYDGACVTDMIQQGVFGMIRAIDMFDTNRGPTFLTYAFHHIKKSMLTYARENNIVRRKGHVQDLVNKANRIIDRMLQDNPSTRITSYIVKKELENSGYTIPKSQSGVRWLNEVIEDIVYDLRIPNNEIVQPPCEEAVEINNFYDIIISSLDARLINLPVRTQEMIKMRFGIGSYIKPMSLIEVASILNITKQSVEQTVTVFFTRNSKLLRNEILYRT